MKLIKRGLLAISVLLILVGIVYASVNVNLSGNKVGPGSIFEGSVNFNFSNTKPLDINMEIHSGNLTHNINLRNLLTAANLIGNPGLVIYNPIYTNSTNSKDSEITASFSGAGSKSEVGFDLRSGPRQASDVNVQNVSFNIEPSGGNPNDVSIYVEGKRVYRYRGSATGWANLERDYLGDFIPDGSQNVLGSNIFCQLVNISDSGEYKISALVKRLAGEGIVGLNATMIQDGPLYSIPNCSDPQTPCCSFGAIAGPNYNHVDCTISKSIPDRKEEYLCVYPANAPNSNRYFSIRTEGSQPILSFVDGNEAESNFYIFGEYRTYDRTLNAGSSVVLPVDDINSYIHGETNCTVNCLLVPFNISVGSSGGVKLSNLVVSYSSLGGDFTEDRFRKISYVPESASYNGTISVQLSKLSNVVAPSGFGNYNLYAIFDGARSNNINFSVVAAPTAFIQYGPTNPGVSEEVIFDASSSTPVNGRNITSYSWQFGDNSIGNGVRVIHAYNATGNYSVTLKVTDSDGVYDIDSLVVNVQSVGSLDLGGLINQTVTSITDFRTALSSSLEHVRDTATLIGINQLVNNLESNLGLIRVNYDLIISNGSLTDTDKVLLINQLKSQLQNLTSQLPAGLNVDRYSFDGKISGLNQVTSCCEFTTEMRKIALLRAQEGITVNGEARLVNLTYADGSGSNFMIVKKNIVGTGSKVYEFAPFGFDITPSNVIVGQNVTGAATGVYSFSPTNQLIYRVDSTDIAKALQTRTAVLPLNLEGFGAVEEPIVELESVCGNDLCENDEDSSSCPEDCEVSNTSQIVIVILFVFIIAAIIYFGWFFKGGLLKKKFGGSAKVGSIKQAFKTEKDHIAVKAYVQNALKKGLGENQIKVALKSKGWNDTQINSVISETKINKKP